MRLTVSGYPSGRTQRTTASLPASIRGAIVVLVLFVIAWLDYVTATAPLQHLYYLPIILAALMFEYWGGLTCALAAIVMYHVANQHLRALNYGESDYLQVLLFIGVGAVTARLARDRRAMQRLAGTDDLTGLCNLRSFESKLFAIANRAQARGTPVSMLVLDVDGLKEINDAYGHLAGAEAVREVGHIIAQSFDGSVVACRYGGDEFAIVMSDSDERSSLSAAESLREAIAGQIPVLAGRQFPKGALTVSVGIATYRLDGVHQPQMIGEELFRAADHALYQAKREGRNRVRFNDDTTVTPKVPAIGCDLAASHRRPKNSVPEPLEFHPS
jgi:diguanylate cyclase (GGDEF)-like protein